MLSPHSLLPGTKILPSSPRCYLAPISTLQKLRNLGVHLNLMDVGNHLDDVARGLIYPL
jgi:hypothetical protein